MYFGPPKTLECPFCATPVKVSTLRSWNNFGAVLWSDSKQIGRGVPDLPAITRCSKCSGFFWLHKAANFTGRISRWAFWKHPKDARHLETFEYLDAIAAGAVSSTEEEIHLRTRAWFAWNDPFRRQPDLSVSMPPQMSTNLVALSALLSKEDDPQQLLMKAEIARELGNMHEARRFLSHPLSPEFATLVEQMNAWISAGETRVQRFQDDSKSGAVMEAET